MWASKRNNQGMIHRQDLEDFGCEDNHEPR